MRILYLQTFPLWGSGSGTYARYLASEVGKRHQVAIVVPDKRVATHTKLYQVKMPLKVAFTGHPDWPKCALYTQISNYDFLRVYHSYLKAACYAVEDFSPNIIHVHHIFPLTWAARYIKALYRINYVVTVHGSELPTLQKQKRYYSLTVDALRRVKKIIPNSYWTKDWFLDILGEEFREKTRVIAPGVFLERFKPDLNTTSLDKKYNLGGKKVVLFAGKLTRYKGVKYLIKAAKKIPAEVVILGDGPERKDLEKRVKRLKLSNVHFVGHLANKTEVLNRFYSRADVFVAPSVWDEPLGLVILESMACKTPVVVTRKGGIPLAVKEGVNGLFVRPRNASEIVEKVNYLLKNDDLRRKMGERARKIVEKKFSWETIAQKFERIYEKYAVKRNKK